MPGPPQRTPTPAPSRGTTAEGLPVSEEKEVRALVEEKMKTAIELPVPIVVELGVGENWLEAH